MSIVINRNNMPNSSILSAFTNQVIHFLTELNELYPQDNDLQMGLEAVIFLKKTNPKLILTGFKEYVYPQKDNILKKNEEVFLTMSTFSNIVSIHSSIVDIINNMQKYWKTFSNATKDKIWLYFAVMIKLIDRYEASL